MKKLIIPLLLFVSGIVFYPVLVDTLGVAQMFYPNSALLDKVQNKVFNFSLGYGLANTFTGRCTKDVSQNGHGWVFVNREYFGCGKIASKISDLIYGEYTRPIDPELAKKLCKDCTY